MTDWQIEGLKTIERALHDAYRIGLLKLPVFLDYVRMLAHSIQYCFESDAAYWSTRIEDLIKESKS